MRFDHLAIPTPDPVASAGFFAAVMGLDVKVSGPEGEFRQVTLADGSFLLFDQAERITPLHVAFHVDRAQFTAVVKHLNSQHIPHGNDPEAPTNGRWEDLHGTYGRVYFFDPAGHFYEVTAP